MLEEALIGGPADRDVSRKIPAPCATVPVICVIGAYKLSDYLSNDSRVSSWAGSPSGTRSRAKSAHLAVDPHPALSLEIDE